MGTGQQDRRKVHWDSPGLDHGGRDQDEGLELSVWSENPEGQHWEGGRRERSHRGPRLAPGRVWILPQSLMESGAQWAASLSLSDHWPESHRAGTRLPCPEAPLSPLDYATVQTVGMTLATIMFVLGILIILSKCPSYLWGPCLRGSCPPHPVPTCKGPDL